MLTDLTTTSLTIDWKAPLTSYQGFRLCWAYGETNSLELGPDVMERTLSDLEAGAEYLVSLAAVVGTGTNQITSEKFTTIVTLCKYIVNCKETVAVTLPLIQKTTETTGCCGVRL